MVLLGGGSHYQSHYSYATAGRSSPLHCKQFDIIISCGHRGQNRQYFDVTEVSCLPPIGVQHFYDAFALRDRDKLKARLTAIQAFTMNEENISSNLGVTCEAALQRRWANHEEQLTGQEVPEGDPRQVPLDVISISSREQDRNSSEVDLSGEGPNDDEDSEFSAGSSILPLLATRIITLHFHPISLLCEFVCVLFVSWSSTAWQSNTFHTCFAD